MTETVETDPSGEGDGDGAPPPGADGSALNDQGFELLRRGDPQSALPLLEQAVSALGGSGAITEAYASYNLAWARLSVGECDGVLDLLDRSEELQGKRKEIDRLRKQAEKNCGE